MTALALHRKRHRRRATVPAFIGMLTVVLVVLLSPGLAHAIENTASGSVNASVLDTTSATVVLNLIAGPVDPGNSSVTVSPANLPANGTSISTITVVLLDAANNPVPGKR